MTGSSLRTLFAVGAAAVALISCASGPSNRSEDATPMDITSLPNLKETNAGLLDLIDRVRRRITEVSPDTTGWVWTDRYDGSTCQDDAGNSGYMLFLPDLLATHGLSQSEWAQVLTDVTAMAAEAGLTEVAMPGTDTHHDVRFYSADGRQLALGSEVNTVITARISCRRDDRDDPIEVDESGAIVMPPAPE